MKEFNELMQRLQKKQYAPVYLLDGEEPYYIDQLLHHFENNILLPEERDFNLITFYGKEAEWIEVANAARRFPMFAERMVVILKEAAQMRDLNALEAYIEHPSPTTILVIEHRFKKLDGRSKLSKTVQKHGVYFTSEKLNENNVPQWIIELGKSMGISIGITESEMLTAFLGNDLQKIVNELEKIKINEPALQQLNVGHIEKYIGISREYNVFDMPDLLFKGDKSKLARMLSYFSANPKSAPMVLMIGTFYNYLNKLLLCHYSPENFQNDRKLGIWTQHRTVAKKMSLPIIHRCIALLEEYSHKTVGIDSTANDTILLREMTGKFNMILYPV
jgi:DNA polymerase-3 subunit delta